MRRGGPPMAAMLALLLITACGRGPALPAAALPALPLPVTNNAVALASLRDEPVLVSLMGLGPGKSWRDVHQRVFMLRPGDDAWSELPEVPGLAGRLAATAVGLEGAVILFGGYTVSPEGHEVSVRAVQRLNLSTGRWTELAPMPVPVDDAVSVLYRGRYVYLVSGWHDTGNVNLVQRYDIEENRWTQATPWPGRPVFGHAGGRVGDLLVVCDGVGIRTRRDRRRAFEAVAACYQGEIQAEDPSLIEWREIPHHGGPATYRMAASGSERLGLVIFAGGSDNPYNYAGTGYDGHPSAPTDRVFAWDPGAGRWRALGRLPVATMDHRGLPETPAGFVILGGMRAGQVVSDEAFAFQP